MRSPSRGNAGDGPHPAVSNTRIRQGGRPPCASRLARRGRLVPKGARAIGRCRWRNSVQVDIASKRQGVSESIGLGRSFHRERSRWKAPSQDPKGLWAEPLTRELSVGRAMPKGARSHPRSRERCDSSRRPSRKGGSAIASRAFGRPKARWRGVRSGRGCARGLLFDCRS